jgi:threonylcarbamoyladenosine tRNA methylthiotransferase MtaB
LAEDGSTRIMPVFSVTTLGCKVNQAESEAIAQCLQKWGWMPARDNENADLCIINTCTVTQKASMQSRQAVRQAIRSNPAAQVFVTGCHAQISPDEIKTIKGVHYIVGNADKHKIPEIILCSRERRLDYPVFIRSDIDREHNFHHMPATALGHRTRFFLKIQDGCDSFCTYCIVPHARGRSRSMPLETVLANIHCLKMAGYREVVLSGVNLGSYGLDLRPQPVRLGDLLNSLQESKPIDRIRLSSINPLELTEDIIERIANSDCFCHHFHISVQSGDDGILSRMHRPYSGSLFEERVIKIHELMPDAAIGVDTLIGFPGETEEAFGKTYAMIEKLPISYLHVFPFSAREGTPACRYPDQVPTKVIKIRCQKIRMLGHTKKKEFYENLIGKKVEVLVEKRMNRSTAFLQGVTSSYVPVFFSSESNLKNAFVSVEVKSLHGNNAVFGTLCSQGHPEPTGSAPNLINHNSLEGYQ